MLRWFFVGYCLCWLGLARAAELTPRQTVVLQGLARERFAPSWEPLGTNELAELQRKADAYDAAIRKNHLVGGLLVSLRYADTNRQQVVAYEALEDSAAWTGFYLASLAVRYGVELRPATLESVREVLGGIERLIGASSRPGHVPRFVGPARDPAYRAVYSQYGGADPKRPGFGRGAFAGTNGLVWLAAPSRDGYSGLNLGLAFAHRFIREPGIRQRVSNIVERILSRIEKDDGRLEDGESVPEFLPPLLSVALYRSGTSVGLRGWGPRYDQLYDLLLAQHRSDLGAPQAPRYGDLRPIIFVTADLVAANLLETNRTRKLLFQEQLSKIWRGAGAELNPWLAAAYVGAYDQPPKDSTANAVLEGVLRQFPAYPRWASAAPLPPDFKVAVVEANGAKWSREALPVFSRPVAPFQWIQNGREYVTNRVAEPVVHPGVDYLIAYWMGRNSTFISPWDLPPLAAKPPPRLSYRPATNTPVRGGGTNTASPAVPPRAAGTNAPPTK